MDKLAGCVVEQFYTDDWQSYQKTLPAALPELDYRVELAIRKLNDVSKKSKK